ncbi:hypothetical protein [Chlorogloeopsis sp. ULAP02]|uniref:hypothetical protein n=1 Tax=Chlorogloeopsis sp. ULAP02 TaxID=3107926 RepID=UPI0031347D2B
MPTQSAIADIRIMLLSKSVDRGFTSEFVLWRSHCGGKQSNGITSLKLQSP